MLDGLIADCWTDSDGVWFICEVDWQRGSGEIEKTSQEAWTC